jgi:hypothetical protein
MAGLTDIWRVVARLIERTAAPEGCAAGGGAAGAGEDGVAVLGWIVSARVAGMSSAARFRLGWITLGGSGTPGVAPRLAVVGPAGLGVTVTTTFSGRVPFCQVFGISKAFT